MNAFEFDFLHHKIVYLRSPRYSPLRADWLTITRSLIARPGQSVDTGFPLGARAGARSRASRV